MIGEQVDGSDDKLLLSKEFVTVLWELEILDNKLELNV